jgi:hypothetical protein
MLPFKKGNKYILDIISGHSFPLVFILVGSPLVIPKGHPWNHGFELRTSKEEKGDLVPWSLEGCCGRHWGRRDRGSTVVIQKWSLP